MALHQATASRLIGTHRALLVLAVLLFAGWAVDQHIPFAGVRMIAYTSGVPNGSVTRPHPLDRVVTDERAHTETLIEDPVYFEIKTAVPYANATLTFRYKNRLAVPLRIGLKRSGKKDDVVFSEPVIERKDGDWTIARAEFDLSGIERMNNRYHFLFSMPGVRYEDQEKGSLTLSGMTISLRRKPIFQL